MTDPLVVFDNVSKHYGDVVAVSNLHLTISEGEFLAIMGSSGCGKTTTLRMLAGLEEPTNGEIRLDGTRMNEVSASERDTPMVWQSLALFPFLNVQKNVEFGLKMRGQSPTARREKANQWLERLDIAELANRDVRQLSGGQRQRVALARSLVTEPRILLLDEPLSALDANLVVRMQGVLARLQKELGITFIYVTHSQSEAFAMSDRVVIMNNGQIEQTGTPREVYRNPETRFVAEFVGSNNILSGTVKDGGDTIVIDSQLGLFSCNKTNKPSPPVGSHVSFVISADLINISMHPTGSLNELKCQFISEEFIGSVVTLLTESEHGSEFKIQKQQREISELDIQPGSTLYINWDLAHAHLLPTIT